MTTTTDQAAPLTPRQREVLAWVVEFTANNGYRPTIRQGQAAFGLRSPNGFLCHVRALARKGLVEWNEREPRSLRVTSAGEQATQLGNNL